MTSELAIRNGASIAPCGTTLALKREAANCVRAMLSHLLTPPSYSSTRVARSLLKEAKSTLSPVTMRAKLTQDTTRAVQRPASLRPLLPTSLAKRKLPEAWAVRQLVLPRYPRPNSEEEEQALRDAEARDAPTMAATAAITRHGLEP
mmetsp:Transcript_22319/g.47550  ORF Transcript_22319/g.47550 Transcript_22319/m.47550 type:complete len:147 (-) Transcript_22319:2-442(-)